MLFVPESTPFFKDFPPFYKIFKTKVYNLNYLSWHKFQDALEWHINCHLRHTEVRLFMKKVAFIIFLFLFAIAANGQQKRNAQPRLQLKRELGMARYLLQQHADVQAEAWIRQAEKLQKEMQRYLANRRLVPARKAGLRAHELATQAIRKLSRLAFQQLDLQVADLLARARNIVPGNGNNEAERLLKKAVGNQQKARHEQRNEQFRKAFELLRTANFQVERSLLLTESAVDDIDAKIRQEQRLFQNLLARAEALLAACDNAQAQKLYRQVTDQRPQIERLIDENRKEEALDSYYQSTRLLLRAIDLCKDADMSPREHAQYEIATLADLLDRAKGREGAPGPERKKAFKQAFLLKEKADIAFANQDYDLALQQARQANSLLSERQASPPGRRRENRLQQELVRLRVEVNKAKNATSAGDIRKGALVSAAGICMQDADDFLQRGDKNLALQSILAGNRFLLQMDARAPSTANDAQRPLQALSDSINAARKRGENVSLVIAADRAAARAQTALDSGNFDTANGFIRLGQEILKLQKP